MKMTDLVHDESYGVVTQGQRRAYRANNVSPVDHDQLVEHYGQHAHAEIIAAVTDPANSLEGGNCFSTVKWLQGLRR